MSAFIEQQKAAGFAVELVCRTLGVSRSAHYERLGGHRSPRAIRDEQLVTTIRRLREANVEAYGIASCTSRSDVPGSMTSAAIA